MLKAESYMVHALLLLERKALPVHPLSYVLPSSYDVPYPF
jgi:hypothetical protein